MANITGVSQSNLYHELNTALRKTEAALASGNMPTLASLPIIGQLLYLPLWAISAYKSSNKESTVNSALGKLYDCLHRVDKLGEDASKSIQGAYGVVLRALAENKLTYVPEKELSGSWQGAVYYTTYKKMLSNTSSSLKGPSPSMQGASVPFVEISQDSIFSPSEEKALPPQQEAPPSPERRAQTGLHFPEKNLGSKKDDKDLAAVAVKEIFEKELRSSSKAIDVLIYYQLAFQLIELREMPFFSDHFKRSRCLKYRHSNGVKLVMKDVFIDSKKLSSLEGILSPLNQDNRNQLGSEMRAFIQRKCRSYRTNDISAYVSEETRHRLQIHQKVDWLNKSEDEIDQIKEKICHVTRYSEDLDEILGYIKNMDEKSFEKAYELWNKKSGYSAFETL